MSVVARDHVVCIEVNTASDGEGNSEYGDDGSYRTPKLTVNSTPLATVVGACQDLSGVSRFVVRKI